MRKRILTGILIALLLVAFSNAESLAQGWRRVRVTWADLTRWSPTTDKVGIGTATPAAQLQIQSTPASDNPNIAFGAATATSNVESAALTFLGVNIYHAGFGWVPNTTTANSKLHLAFGTNGDPASNTTQVTFQANGRVGIGTTTPAGRLGILNDGGYEIYGEGASDLDITTTASTGGGICLGTREAALLFLTTNNRVGIGNSAPAGVFVVAPPSAETIAAAATITADGCGTIKQITAASAVATNTTNTFTAPAAANAGCVMHVINVGANAITLDANALFVSAGAADVILGAGDTCTVASTGASGKWYQISGSNN